VRSAVDVVAHHDVVARLERCAQQGVLGREPGREAVGTVAALERREQFLQRRARRVATAGVLIAAAEAADAVLHERRGLVDRRHDGAGRGVEGLPGHDGAGREAVVLVGHVSRSVCCVDDLLNGWRGV
jgi:hypothetical protein